MASQLDILALEPFFGGARKSMLDTILRFSRHRWTLLKLPPRRIERRLQAAAIWFAEQLSRHWVGRVDVLFVSEAMNLSDLLRLVPELARKPAVVYYHDNQIPPVDDVPENPLHLVNISSATAATEIWFNSLYHLRTFFRRASSLVEQVPELAGRNPLPALTGKAVLMSPPVDRTRCDEILQVNPVERDPRMIFVDTRDADVALLNSALGGLYRRGEKYKLVTVGPAEGLDEELPRQTIPENDEDAQIRALQEAAVMVSGRPGANYDHHAIRALQLGCWPMFPNTGFYPEILPKSMHATCLYDSRSHQHLATQLQNVWWIQQPEGYANELAEILGSFDAARVCAEMDDRLEHLAISSTVK